MRKDKSFILLISLMIILCLISLYYESNKFYGVKEFEYFIIKSNNTDYSEIVKETDDGFIFGRMKIHKEGDTNSENLYVPCIEKYNDVGELIWEKEFNYPIEASYITLLEVMKDNSIVFYIEKDNVDKERSKDYKSYVFKSEKYKSYLLKCDKYGKELWKKDFNNKLLFPYTTYLWYFGFNNFYKNNVFVVGDNGEIYRIENKVLEGIFTVTKLGENGDVLKEKSYDWNHKFIASALFNKNIGIVLNTPYSRQISNILRTTEETYVKDGIISCLGENLDLKWKSYGYYDTKMKISNELIFAHSISTPLTSSMMSFPFLRILDNNGKDFERNRNVKEKELGWVRFADRIYVLQNDDYITYTNDSIAIFNKDGNMISVIEGLDSRSIKISSTNDGGFVLILQREVKELYLFHPENTFDTERVVMKFDNEYSLEWEESIDMYKNSAKEDLVFPLSNGKLVIIEKE